MKQGNDRQGDGTTGRQGLAYRDSHMSAHRCRLTECGPRCGGSSNARHDDFLFLVVRVDPDAPPPDAPSAWCEGFNWVSGIPL